MAKSKRGKRSGATTETAVAERHDFSAGLLGHDAGDYHVNVSERTALGVDVVYSCVRTLADAVADARWQEWRDRDPLPASRLVQRPMSTWTRRRWSWRVAATLALYNVCHLERIGRDSDGMPLSLRPIVPGALIRYPDGRLAIMGQDGARAIREEDIRTLHRADWPSISEEAGALIAFARETFAAAWAAESYRTDFWEHGGVPSVVLTSDQKLTNDDAEDYSNRWVARRQLAPGAPAVMGQGVKAERFGADISASGSGEDMDRLGASIARFIGVPPWIVNVASAAGSMVYSNTEGAAGDLIRYSLRGYLGPIEDAITDELPGSAITGRHMAMDVSHLTAGTLLERYQAYAIATAGRPWMTPAEVRRDLNLPPDMALDPNGAPAPALERIPEGV